MFLSSFFPIIRICLEILGKTKKNKELNAVINISITIIIKKEMKKTHFGKINKFGALKMLNMTSFNYFESLI